MAWICTRTPLLLLLSGLLIIVVEGKHSQSPSVHPLKIGSRRVATVGCPLYNSGLNDIPLSKEKLVVIRPRILLLHSGAASSTPCTSACTPQCTLADRKVQAALCAPQSVHYTQNNKYRNVKICIAVSVLPVVAVIHSFG